jgi:hypothetical protein
MCTCSHTYAVSKRESLKVSIQQKGPNKSGASLVRHRSAYALVSTHCFASASQAWPVAQDIEASCSPCIPHPSARAKGAERTRANSDAVRVFIVVSFWLW